MRYRAENLFGSGYRDVIDVCVYECRELGNIDILTYVSNHHITDGTLHNEIESIIAEIEDNGFVDDWNDDDWRDFFSRIMEAIWKTTGYNIKYCLWLADYDGVQSYFTNYIVPDDDIDAYEEGPIILSDIELDGTLYGYEEYPEPIGTYADFQ